MKISGIANLHDKELIDVRFDESMNHIDKHVNGISQLSTNSFQDVLDASRAVEQVIEPQINVIEAMKDNIPDLGNTVYKSTKYQLSDLYKYIRNEVNTYG